MCVYVGGMVILTEPQSSFQGIWMGSGKGCRFVEHSVWGGGGGRGGKDVVCRAEVEFENAYRSLCVITLSVEMRVGCACRAAVWLWGHNWLMSVRTGRDLSLGVI